MIGLISMKILCNHKNKDYQVIYRNQGISNNLKYIINYEIRVCKNCKRRYKVQIKNSFELDGNNSYAK